MSIPETDKYYHIDGSAIEDGDPDILLDGQVFEIQETDDGHYDVYITCILTGDEYAVSTKDALFTERKPPTWH